MIDPKVIHREAMAVSDQALVARLNGNEEQARKFFRSAFEKEMLVAAFYRDKLDAEPARSVVYRSAATLAQDCGFFHESERLIYQALSGKPPIVIEEELRNLLDEVSFHRHLELRGVKLADDEMQLALTGDDVGFGVAPADMFLSRVQNIETLLYRTAERKLSRPYRDHGRKTREVEQQVKVFMAVPRAACFAVTLRIGGAAQPSLSGLSESETTIDEFIECLDLFTKADEAGLKARIGADDYYRNFIGLAQALQPDGKSIKTVGLTTSRHGITRSVALRSRPPATIKLGISEIVGSQVKTSGDSEAIEIEGMLLIANAEKKSDTQSGVIEIVMASGRKVKVTVPPGLMADIVRPLWESRVRVTGIRKGKRVYLTQIRDASQSTL